MMSSSAPIRAARASAESCDWHVRRGQAQDAGAVAAAVSRLLNELGGTPPPLSAMESTTARLLGEDTVGAVLVAEADGKLVGVLAASWQTAIHVPGCYALIQDLWVDRAWRSRAIGSALLDALRRLAHERGVTRLEVGLPREYFAALASTEAFYRREGFVPLGTRMRRMLQ
jgi:GNAT superfamily N-acetyltransferase